MPFPALLVYPAAFPVVALALCAPDLEPLEVMRMAPYDGACGLVAMVCRGAVVCSLSPGAQKSKKLRSEGGGKQGAPRFPRGGGAAWDIDAVPAVIALHGRCIALPRHARAAELGPHPAVGKTRRCSAKVRKPTRRACVRYVHNPAAR